MEPLFLGSWAPGLQGCRPILRRKKHIDFRSAPVESISLAVAHYSDSQRMRFGAQASERFGRTLLAPERAPAASRASAH
jgi:hypothetical protein